MLTHPALADLAGLSHGFFTRVGGVSQGLYASLNCGFGSGDDVGLVAENRASAMARLGLPPDALVGVHQIHSPDVVTVETPWTPANNPRADGLVTRVPGIALGILTADCVPVLFVDPVARVIGAAHAGWKGAAFGVLDAVVAAMTCLGAAPQRIRAAIGPAIRQASYEVGPEFPGHFPAAGHRFVPSDRVGYFRFDLPGVVADQLARLDLAAIGDLGLDTAADPDQFFSYRRATLAGEKDYGRMLSAIALLP